MEKVIISPLVMDKLETLIDILFEEEYFGFMESCIEYVIDVYDFILTIPSLKKKRTKNSRYGDWYCSYKKNRNTTYYITFNFNDDIYLIKNIINNHGRDYPAFIRGIK